MTRRSEHSVVGEVELVQSAKLGVGGRGALPIDRCGNEAELPVAFFEQQRGIGLSDAKRHRQLLALCRYDEVLGHGIVRDIFPNLLVGEVEAGKKLLISSLTELPIDALEAGEGLTAIRPSTSRLEVTMPCCSPNWTSANVLMIRSSVLSTPPALTNCTVSSVGCCWRAPSSSFCAR